MAPIRSILYRMTRNLLNKIGKKQGENQIEQQRTAQNIKNCHLRSDMVDRVIKLVRFAHNWNDGILEKWNNGFWDNAMLD